MRDSYKRSFDPCIIFSFFSWPCQLWLFSPCIEAWLLLWWNLCVLDFGPVIGNPFGIHKVQKLVLFFFLITANQQGLCKQPSIKPSIEQLSSNLFSFSFNFLILWILFRRIKVQTLYQKSLEGIYRHKYTKSCNTFLSECLSQRIL